MTEEYKTLASLTSSYHRQVVPAVDVCLDDDDILAFVQGRLEGDGLSRVHGHVDNCELCQCLVAEAAHALEASPISESVRPSWNSVFRPNAMIDKRYRIIRLVARGGMGEVYEAYDTALQVRVALKTVTSTDCDNTRAVQLLKAEVQLARRISHPNVCRIYDLGTHVLEGAAGEIQFLVMEFVDGECLGKKLRQYGPLPLHEAYSIAQDLLLGLRAAHDAGIMHRDFKSDNVMLRRDSNGKYTPVILDFGLAKALNETGSIATTQGHAMVGTIGYMAPEQIEGGPLSFASDIYAFGVVWFEMITGRLPFEGDTPIASAVARLSRPPKRASSVNSAVPIWLDDVISKCLRRDPNNRYASAREVLTAIEGKKHLTENRLARGRGTLWRRSLVTGALVLASVFAIVAGLGAGERAAKAPQNGGAFVPSDRSEKPVVGAPIATLSNVPEPPKSVVEVPAEQRQSVAPLGSAHLATVKPQTVGAKGSSPRVSVAQQPKPKPDLGEPDWLAPKSKRR